MRFFDWGLIDYKTALDQQLDLVNEVYKGAEDAIVFCSHPPVVTLGRASQDSDILHWSGETISVQRGGRATYHGPGQIVIYPIMNLQKTLLFPKKDVGRFLRFLEEVVIEAFQKMGIEAYQKNEEMFDEKGKKLLMTGVWVQNYKVASIGIALKRWVSFHGIAIHFFKDSQAFQGISPCGFASSPMKSVEEIFDKTPDRTEFIDFFKQSF